METAGEYSPHPCTHLGPGCFSCSQNLPHRRLLSVYRGFSTPCGTFVVGIGRKVGDPEYLRSPWADSEKLH